MKQEVSTIQAEKKSGSVNAADIVACVFEFLGPRAAGMTPESLLHQNFEQLGMDSVDCLLAVVHVEDHLALTLDPTLFLSHPNIASALSQIGIEPEAASVSVPHEAASS